MIFLFNQHWDIIPGKEEEYTQFAINHYIPTMKKIGINGFGKEYVKGLNLVPLPPCL